MARITQDDTLSRWVSAADTLTPAQTRECIAALSRAARHADDDADLLPTVMLAVAAGQTPRVAARVAVEGAARSRSRGQAASLPSGTGWEGEGWVPTAPSAEAECLSRMGQDDDTPDTPRLGDVLPSATKGTRVILSALAAHGLAQPGAAQRLGWKAPLRVNVVAQALGQPAPRRATASALLRAAACRAWGEVSVRMGARVAQPLPLEGPARAGYSQPVGWGWATAPESVEGRAERALRYVSQPNGTQRGALSHPVGEGSRYALGQRQGIPFTAPQPVACRRPLEGPAAEGASQPVGWATVGQAPERASHYRPVAPTRWAPQPRVTDGVEEGLPYGTAGATGLPDREVLPALEGQRWARDDARQAAAAAAADRAADPRVCPAPVGPAGAGAGYCHCGARPADTQLTAEGRHPLTPCPAPRVTERAAAEGGPAARCGCRSRAGALTRESGDWCHPMRHKR